MGLEIPDWVNLGFEPLSPYAVEAGHPLSPLSPLRLVKSVLWPPLSPPPAAEVPLKGSILSPLTQNLPITMCSSGTPPTLPQTTLPLPPTPQTPDRIRHFDFCPFTQHGQICQFVSWEGTSSKQIKRHMKVVHFPNTSLGYECPNPNCKHRGFRFLRRDACAKHRKSCDSRQPSGYVPLPNVVSGGDQEVDKWMKARYKQRWEIVRKLKMGIPWSTDLLEPVNI